jgi:hypothetical protein
MFKNNNRLVVFKGLSVLFFPNGLLELLRSAEVFKNSDFIFAVFLFAQFASILNALGEKLVNAFLNLGFIDLILEFGPLKIHEAL